ncbi:fatty-acyl-CoA synthase/long-chain acyl-CoA synthetase [Alteromonadaceae bacterium 2753L.S.0a.02]|nr:fatty-acyl-CoA synthase/long-chain acyl-CoA synthetase [Alteromonadaceae bacterium 2753L.S.0a.02]
MLFEVDYKRGIYAGLKNSATAFPDRIALICGAQRFSYRELINRVDHVASTLGKEYSKVDRIALHLNNCSDAVVVALAVAQLGKILIPLNPALRKPQLLTQIEATQAQLVITTQAGVKFWHKLTTSLPCLCSEELLGEQVATIQEIQQDISRPYLVTSSSGSTGKPKPIVLSQRSKLQRSKQAADCYSITNNDVILCASPFYHSLGQRLVFLPLLHGATLVLLEHFSANAWLTSVRQHKVTFTIAVASHLQALERDLIKRDSDLNSLRCLVSSSTAINKTLKHSLMENLGCEFHEMYGATEIATATNLTPLQAHHKPDSVGSPLPGVKILILNDKHQSLMANHTGEIAVETPLQFNGYLNEDQLTSQSYHEGYFLTGDLGYLDEHGYLYFVSRKKDIIITGGINVVPSDIEKEINAFPGIKECCVIATMHEYLGEAVLAVCVAENDTVPDSGYLQGLRLSLNETLAGFQQPRYFVFVDAVPLTSSGKPDKEILRKTYCHYSDAGEAHG